jgi:hypothetical protein
MAERYKNGRIAIEDYLEARFERLDGEIALLQARAKQAKKDLSRLKKLPGIPLGWGLPIPLDAKALPNARFALNQADIRQLARRRLEAARGMLEPRWKDFEAGRGTMDIFLESSVQALESALAVASNEDDALAAYTWHWALAWKIHALNKRRFEAGRIAGPDYAQARYHLLRAEIRLLEVMSKPGSTQKSPLAGSAPNSPRLADPLPPKELAQARLELRRADLRQLRRSLLETARWEYEERTEDFLAGRGIQCIYQDSSDRILEAEMALDPTKSGRLLAAQKYWERALIVEHIDKGRFFAGRLSSKEYAGARYLRLKAEIQMIEAK